jgi:DNA (cytosine-5)-methyltransferase 1
VIIVGIRNDLNISWSFPEATHCEENLLWDQFVTGDYWKRHGVGNFSDSLRTKGFEQKLKRLKKKYSLFSPPLKPWLTVRDSIGCLPKPTFEGTHEYPDHIFKSGARTYPGHTGSPFDAPSKTIKAGGHGVPGGENMILYPDGQVRYYTTYEAKLIQTFPRDFKISGAWGENMRQIGNAVPVKLAKTLSRNLVGELKKIAA